MYVEISSVGLHLIKHFEGCQLTAYQDAAGIWTVGYGHTNGVKPNETTTQAQAEQFLREDLRTVYLTVEQTVRVPLAQNQFDALCAFIFNIGAGNFMRSTLLTRLNAKEYQSAADEFLKWDYVVGNVLPGLEKRRVAERKLFLGDGFDT